MSGSAVAQSTVNRSRKGATRLREETIGRKKASRVFQDLRGRRLMVGRMLEVISEGKRGLDGSGMGFRADGSRGGDVPYGAFEIGLIEN